MGNNDVLYFGTKEGKLYAVQTSANGLSNNAPWPTFRHEANVWQQPRPTRTSSASKGIFRREAMAEGTLAERIAYVRGLVAAYEATRRLAPVTKRLEVWVEARLEAKLLELRDLEARLSKETNPELH